MENDILYIHYKFLECTITNPRTKVITYKAIRKFIQYSELQNAIKVNPLFLLKEAI